MEQQIQIVVPMVVEENTVAQMVQITQTAVQTAEEVHTVVQMVPIIHNALYLQLLLEPQQELQPERQLALQPLNQLVQMEEYHQIVARTEDEDHIAVQMGLQILTVVQTVEEENIVVQMVQIMLIVAQTVVEENTVAQMEQITHNALYLQQLLEPQQEQQPERQLALQPLNQLVQMEEYHQIVVLMEDVVHIVVPMELLIQTVVLMEAKANTVVPMELIIKIVVQMVEEVNTAAQMEQTILSVLCLQQDSLHPNQNIYHQLVQDQPQQHNSDVTQEVMIQDVQNQRPQLQDQSQQHNSDVIQEVMIQDVQNHSVLQHQDLQRSLLATQDHPIQNVLNHIDHPALIHQLHIFQHFQ
jgi:hypothetical protein